MDDERIIELFFQRNEDAIKYTNETYGKRLFHRADNITKNDEDAEECVNSTYMKTWNTIPPKCPSFFFAYIAKIFRHLALDKENDFIFKWPNGKPFSPDYISSHFSLLLKNNHLPHIRFHELRHSCASLLLNSGFTLKDVQEYMGHSDIQMIANIYGHLDTQRKNLLTEKITASIF